MTLAVVFCHKKIISSTAPNFVLALAGGNNVVTISRFDLILTAKGGNDKITTFGLDDISSIRTDQFIKTLTTDDLVFTHGRINKTG